MRDPACIMDQVLQDLLDELTEHQVKKTVEMDLSCNALASAAPPSSGDELNLANGLTKGSESVILRQKMSKSSFEYKKRMCVASLKSNSNPSSENASQQHHLGPRSRKALHPNDVGAFLRHGGGSRLPISRMSLDGVRKPFEQLAKTTTSSIISHAR